MAKLDLPGDPWQYATWEGSERARLLAGAQLSLREKLAWLEEAADVVERLHKPPVRVTAAVIRRNGEVLLARRRPGSHLEGLWEFPGGKVEFGETPEECLARELHEEFGVEAHVGAFLASSLFEYEDRRIELLAYEAELAPGDWTLDSHDEARWVDESELLDRELAPADIPIAERLVRASREAHRPAARKRS